MARAHTLRAPILLAVLLAIAACASDRPGRVVQTSEAAQRACPTDKTFSCVERMGEVVRCFCADKDALRDLLEPVTTY